MSKKLKIDKNLEAASQQEVDDFHFNLSGAKIKMMKKLSFWSLILSRLTIMREDQIPTAAVDQHSKMYINPKFFNELTQAQRCFVLAHECGHPAFMHMYRGKVHTARKEKVTIEKGENKGKEVIVNLHGLWNVAIDYSINMMLYESLENQGLPNSIPKDPKTGNYQWLFDLKYMGMSAETIFDMLMQEIKDGEHSIQEIQSLGDDGDGDGRGQGDDEQDGDGDGDGEGGGGSLKEGQQGSASGKWNGQGGFDQHINNAGKNSSEENTKEQIDRAQWGSVLNHARNIAKAKGQLPAGMEQVLSNLLDSQISWTDVLAQFIVNSVLEVAGRGGDFTWMNQNRRMIANGIYMPGWVAHQPVIAALCDTSGSMHEELEAALGELYGIKQSMDTRIIVIAGDTEVQKVTEIEPGTEIPLDDLFRGGGGTVLKPLFDHAVDPDNGYNPNILICFTDGYIDNIPPEYEEFEVIWVVFDNDSFTPNFGEVIRVDSKAYTR